MVVMAAQGQSLAAILPTLGVLALTGYRLIPTLQLLYGQLAQLATMTHHLDEIYDEFAAVERHEPEAGQLARPPKPRVWKKCLTLEGVSYAYPGAATPVLRNVSLTIPKGSCVAFVGTTGCGKSTLMDLLLGLHRPTAGRVLVDGAELRAEEIPAWQVGIGYVPQDIFLLDDTVAANIALGVSEKDRDLERLREVCAIAQILSFIENELPLGFETRVGERGVRLSGGQRQRIGLARALYHRPQLLILDEATSALDTSTERGVMEAIDALKGKITMILVAHRLSTIQSCEQVFDLGAREIAEQAAL
jgi:ABC-type multidrug transport system fused ATPase/permease subunit